MLLPAAPDDPLPQISDAVLLTHLRTEVQAEEANLALTTGTDEPGIALPGGGTGKAYESPHTKLSELIATLNERFGMNLGEADRIWFEQQRQVIKNDAETRIVALHNDRSQYQIVLEKTVDNMIIDRHEANGQLFGAYFEKPGFREALLRFLAGTYDEIRDEEAQ